MTAGANALAGDREKKEKERKSSSKPCPRAVAKELTIPVADCSLTRLRRARLRDLDASATRWTAREEAQQQEVGGGGERETSRMNFWDDETWSGRSSGPC